LIVGTDFSIHVLIGCRYNFVCPNTSRTQKPARLAIATMKLVGASESKCDSSPSTRYVPESFVPSAASIATVTSCGRDARRTRAASSTTTTKAKNPSERTSRLFMIPPQLHLTSLLGIYPPLQATGCGISRPDFLTDGPVKFSNWLENPGSIPVGPGSVESPLQTRVRCRIEYGTCPLFSLDYFAGITTNKNVANGPSNRDSSHQIRPRRPLHCARPALRSAKVSQPTA
jgi:hypothetical protein